jgi:arginyl-tRNA synthetase
MAAKNYSPNLLCNYLYDLAQKFNNFYNKHRILTQNLNVKTQNYNLKVKTENQKQCNNTTIEQFRLTLTASTGQVIKTGLNLLGIRAPERM